MQDDLESIKVKLIDRARFWAKVSRVWVDDRNSAVYLDKIQGKEFPLPTDYPITIKEPSEKIVTIMTAAMINRSLVEVFIENGFVIGVVGYWEKP